MAKRGGVWKRVLLHEGELLQHFLSSCANTSSHWTGSLHVSPTIIRWFTAKIVGGWSLLTFPAPHNLKHDTDPLSSLINGLLRWKYHCDKERNMKQEGMLTKWLLTGFDLKTCDMHATVKVCQQEGRVKKTRTTPYYLVNCWHARLWPKKQIQSWDFFSKSWNTCGVFLRHERERNKRENKSLCLQTKTLKLPLYKEK